MKSTTSAIASTSRAAQKQLEGLARQPPILQRSPAYEGATTRLVRRTAGGDEEVVPLNDVRVDDFLLSLNANGDEGWVRVCGLRGIQSARVISYSTRYLNDDANFALGGYAVCANTNRVLCSFPPPYVTQDRSGTRHIRETYQVPRDGRIFEISGCFKSEHCSVDGSSSATRQGFHKAACSPDRRAWVERMQRALDAELGRGFTVGRTPKVPLLTITDTATRRVHVCAGRRDFKSTWRFQGNFFYRIVEEHGRRTVVPILNPGAAVDELYRKLEETYVPFTWRDPNDLMEDDLARSIAMTQDEAYRVTGTVQFNGAGETLMVGVPIGARREPTVQETATMDDLENEDAAALAYLLGLWLGDGCVTAWDSHVAQVVIGVSAQEDLAATINRANNDETFEDEDDDEMTDTITTLKKLARLKASGYITQYDVYDCRQAPRPRQCAVLRIVSRSFTSWLRDLGIISCKGDGDYEELTMEMLRQPTEIRKELLAGMLDADGHRDDMQCSHSLVLTQAVEGGIDHTEVPNAARGHDEIFALFAVLASSIPMDVRYRIRRAKVGDRWANYPGGRDYDDRLQNMGEAYVLSPDTFLPCMPRKTTEAYPAQFIRLGSTFGRWSDPKRRADCIDITVDGGSGHLLLANGTVIAVNVRADENSSDD